MIRQDGNGNGNNRRTGRSKEYAQYIPAALAVGSYLLDQGPRQSGTSTSTQQNLPSWATPFAQNTLDMGRYFTNNPNYRPRTLDQDYSGIRGFNPDGSPVSQVGQFGLNPSPSPSPAPAPTQTEPEAVTENPVNVEGFGRIVPSVATTLGKLLAKNEPGLLSSGRVMQNMGPDSFKSKSRGGGRSNSFEIDLPDLNFDSLVEDTWLDNRPQSDPGELAYPTSLPETPTQSPQGNILPNGSNSEGSGYPTGGTTTPQVDPIPPSSSPEIPTQPTAGMSPEEIQALIDQQLQQFDLNTITPDELPTPFQSYDRQRFAGPSADTMRGEGILSGRYDQRFGTRGTDPFAAANQAVGSAANYQSGFQGTTSGIGGQAGNYQRGLGSARNPNVFRSQNYMNQMQGYENPNQGMQAENYARDFRQNLNQFRDPYTDQVVNQTIKDMDRAKQMTANQISGDAAKSGAFGGSRSMLMQAENNRNFADRTAAAVGQLRSQGFQKAADRAQQEQLQRLGLSASDIQNVRGLQSQGALAALGQRGQDFRTALGQTAAGDRSAMGYNAGLLSNAMGLDASDLNQRRNIASNESQFEETANRGAGALNLQGGTALGQLAQAGTGDERQRIADMLAGGGAQTERNQQDLEFIYNEFNRELGYPGQQIDLRNAAISPATGSIVTTSQPRYQQNPILGGFGGALTTYGITKNPYLAGVGGLLSYLNS